MASGAGLRSKLWSFSRLPSTRQRGKVCSERTLYGAHHKQSAFQVLPALLLPSRQLSVHEHYSLDLINRYGVSVPKGEVAYTANQAKNIASKLGRFLCGSTEQLF